MNNGLEKQSLLVAHILPEIIQFPFDSWTLLYWRRRRRRRRKTASDIMRLMPIWHTDTDTIIFIVTFKLCVTVHQCLHSHSPDYLSELCTPVAQVAELQHLRSASRCLLVVPRIQLDTYCRRTFAVVGPTVWNALSNDLDLRDLELSIASFRCFSSIRSSHWAH